MANAPLRYKRSRFSTRLPTDRLYTAGHYWLFESEPRLWQVGLTKFAHRMLGDTVEFDFEVGEGAAVEVGQVIGWLEGFKAMTDVYSPMSGRFAGANPALLEKIELLKSDPHGRGWLFAVEGEPGEDCVDASGYASFLDATIDKMLGKPS
jgi:glycine cleavage system H protein